jgi:hypothetical protein
MFSAFSDICLPAPAPFGVKKAAFWGVNVRVFAAHATCRGTRKFDVHACEAGMNIKFPIFCEKESGTCAAGRFY